MGDIHVLFRKYRLFILPVAFMLLLLLTGSMDPLLPAGRPVFPDSLITVPLGGNAWRSGEGKKGGYISDQGITQWTDKRVSFTAYVRVDRPGDLTVALDAEVPEGESTLEITMNKKSRRVTLSSRNQAGVKAGTWPVKDTGYLAIQITGISRTGHIFAHIPSLRLSGSAIDEKTAFVRNNEDNFFYWGRRGPSVHLNFQVPEGVHAEWFYNEVTVPEGNDILGSYFMADGFGEGYFGMQVNSPTTRHILFSVWSPFSTDDPKKIPDSMRIGLLAKGDRVHAGEFGNEGSGGQSYLNYMWKAGTTYKFLLHGVPDGAGHTVYTAYFYAPEEGKWLLIASFSRPRSDTYLTHLHSFLENFSPPHGDRERMVLFGNQWICTNEGKWMPLDKMRFTTDNTGRKGYRMDYAGGVRGDRFFLQNCGFFNHYTPAGTRFSRAVTQSAPQVDFEALPAR